MSTEMEKARVTELHVRIDCNGCVQRIKKAMHRVDGVRDVNVDIAQQRIIVVGGADPETLVKAIKKATKKNATIYSHTEPAAPDPPPAEVTVTPEPPKDIPPQETPTETTAAPEGAQVAKDVERPHVVHDYPHNYAYREHWNDYAPIEHDVMRQQAPYHATHSYSSHRPSPYVSEYVSEYGYGRSPPRDTRYHVEGGYGDGYNNYQNRGGDRNQISSMFSDENPNACRIT